MINLYVCGTIHERHGTYSTIVHNIHLNYLHDYVLLVWYDGIVLPRGSDPLSMFGLHRVMI